MHSLTRAVCICSFSILLCHCAFRVFFFIAWHCVPCVSVYGSLISLDSIYFCCLLFVVVRFFSFVFSYVVYVVFNSGSLLYFLLHFPASANQPRLQFSRRSLPLYILFAYLFNSSFSSLAHTVVGSMVFDSVFFPSFGPLLTVCV